ncbi:MAG: putative transporter substrate-binding protein, partial [Dehalococcoidia bacterium]|nr:putative transporter substrate-binding protein [Dehalococcoidia bacterium]
MKRFGYWLMSLVMVAGLLFSACASPKAPSPATPPSSEKPSATTPGAPATPGTAQTREQKLIEAAKAAGEKEVVMWMYSWYHGPVEQAFEAKYPFLKLKVSDLSVEVEPRMIEEYKAGRYSADVVGVPLRRAVRLKAAGVLQEYPFPNWPNTWPNQPKHNFWRQTTAAFYAPAYNTQMVALADAPRTWDDLTAARWRGNAIISTSGTAEILLGYAYMTGDLTASGIKWDNTVNFWKKVVDTVRPRVGSGFKGPL